MNSGNPPVKRWYAISLGAVIIFIVFAVSASCLPVLFSEIREKLGLTIVEIGLVWGLSSVAGIFSILAAGLLADRFGCRRVLAITCLLAGVFGASRGLADSFATLAITSLLFGVASEAVPVIVVKAVSQWFQGRGLATVQGVLSGSVGAGMMTGALLSATVLSPALGGWERVLFLYGGISVVLAAAWFLLVPDAARTEGQPMAQGRPNSAGHVFRTGGVWLIAIAMMGFAGCNKGTIGYLPLYLRGRGWSDAAADGALAALNAAGTAAAVPFTLLSDRLGKRKSVLLPGLVLTILGVGLLPVVGGFSIWVLVIITGLFRDVVWAVAATMTVETEGVGPAYAGTAVGMVHAFTRVGYTFAPPLGNSLETFGSGLPFVVWAGLAVVALVAFLFVGETGLGKSRRVTIE